MVGKLKSPMGVSTIAIILNILSIKHSSEFVSLYVHIWTTLRLQQSFCVQLINMWINTWSVAIEWMPMEYSNTNWTSTSLPESKTQWASQKRRWKVFYSQGLWKIRVEYCCLDRICLRQSWNHSSYV